LITHHSWEKMEAWGGPERSADERRVEELRNRADLDRETIRELRAQGAADRVLIGDLHVQAGLDRATIDKLEGQVVADRAVIDQLEAEGIIDRGKIANLETALVTARRIGAAMGILMSSRHLTDAEAFELLREASHRRQRKLRDLVDDVLLTGELP